MIKVSIYQNGKYAIASPISFKYTKPTILLSTPEQQPKITMIQADHITSNKGGGCNPCHHVTAEGNVINIRSDRIETSNDNTILPYFYYNKYKAKANAIDNWSFSALVEVYDVDITQRTYHREIVESYELSSSGATATLRAVSHVYGTDRIYNNPPEPFDRVTERIFHFIYKDDGWYMDDKKLSTVTCDCFGHTSELLDVLNTAPPTSFPLTTADLMQRAFDQLKMTDVNTLAYVKDFAGIPAMAKDTLKSIMNLKNPKSWADLFLSGKYGWKMSYLDTISLANSISEFASTIPPKQQRIGSSCSAEGWVHTLSFTVDNSTTPGYQLRRVIGTGFWPTATNLWDFVPYSFVVNWLTGLDSIFEAIDANLYRDILKVHSICSSYKFVGDYPTEKILTNSFGHIHARIYHRYVLDSLPRVPYQLDPKGLKGHGWEAAALIVQRVAK